MEATKRCNIKIGTAVLVVQKQDQRTGKITEGIVKKVLTIYLSILVVSR